MRFELRKTDAMLVYRYQNSTKKERKCCLSTISL